MDVPVCRYYRNGNCRYGDFCRNLHAQQPEAAMRSSTTTAATLPVTSADRSVESQDPNNNCTRTTESTRNWIDAPEFVPRYITRNAASDESTNPGDSNDIHGASRLVHTSPFGSAGLIFQMNFFLWSCLRKKQQPADIIRPNCVGKCVRWR